MRRPRRPLLALCTICAGLSLTAAGGGSEPPDSLVYDAMAAPATISYSGVVEMIRIGNLGSQASVCHIEHRAPNQTLRRYTSPPELAGDVVISKGDEDFTVDVTRRRIVESRNRAMNDQIAVDDNYLLMRQNYRAVTRGAETFDGRNVADIALINNYTHRTTMLVRIDERTKLVLDRQRFAGDGSLVAETRFESVEYAPSVPAEDFAMPGGFPVVRGLDYGTPSDDPSRVSGDAGFAARSPKFLPEGFSPVVARIVTLRSVRTLHVLYSDGLRTVSLFESSGSSEVGMESLHPATIEVGGHPAQYAESGPTGLLAWHDGSLHYTLVGELQIAELKRIAVSI